MGLIQQGVRLEIPHEPGNFLTFNDLKGKELDDAARVQVQHSIAYTAALPPGVDAARLEELKPKRSPEEAAAAKAEKDTHDAVTLIKHAVVGWDGPIYEATAFDAELLDGPTREWALSIIYERNIRPTQAESDSGPD